MKDLMSTIFGTYTAISYETTDGALAYVEGIAGVDWTYVLGVGLFALVLYCGFRLMGTLFKEF